MLFFQKNKTNSIFQKERCKKTEFFQSFKDSLFIIQRFIFIVSKIYVLSFKDSFSIIQRFTLLSFKGLFSIIQRITFESFNRKLSIFTKCPD